MNKIIAIVAGEPNSISSEIIFKSWLKKKKYKHFPFFVIGSIRLLNLQKKKLKYKLNLKKIGENFKISDLKGYELPIYDVDFNQKKAFEKISLKSNKYIFKCFNHAIKLHKDKKIMGFINCPVSKETLFPKKKHGITEFLAKKTNNNENEVMLLFNKELAVSPITTHIPFAQVTKKINKNKIVKKALVINDFYIKKLKKKPRIGILGLNPHNSSSSKKSIEKEIIYKAVKYLSKLKLRISGPIVTDSSFLIYKKDRLDVLIGMYHDQVLTPFKSLFHFDAINITLGLNYFRVSPDHGPARDIVNKKKANHLSLLRCVNFINSLN